jgi:hypothetical protein
MKHAGKRRYHDIIVVRAQVQLSAGQMAALRRLSTATGRSMADLVREGVEQVLSSARRKGTGDPLERALRVAGRFSSGKPDVSRNHDRYFAGSLKRPE